MADPTKTRWTLTDSKGTDVALRSFLAQRVLKKGDLSVLVETSLAAKIVSLGDFLRLTRQLSA